MAADMHIHIADTLTDDDLRCLFSSTIGSSWCDLDADPTKPIPGECADKFDCEHWTAWMATPNIWIGAVSWLKAALLDDESYIPGTILQISELIDDRATVVIDDEFIRKVGEAFEAPADSYYRRADRSEVVAWLESHRGSRVVDVSW